MLDDPTKTNPLGLFTTPKAAAISNAVAPMDEYLAATGDSDLTLSVDCVFVVGPSIFKTLNTVLRAGNLDQGAAFLIGNDYYVYICDSGVPGEEVYLISLNSTFPQGYNANNSRKIGGFHYGMCRRVDSYMRPLGTSGLPYSTGWQSNVYIGIVPRSVWTLFHRPKCAPEGMVYAGGGMWVDIYLSSDDGYGGLKSAFNVVPLTGTEGHNWYSFNDRAFMVGKRMLSYAEWCNAAYGSPQGLAESNDHAWTQSAAPANTGRNVAGGVANAVSSIGCRDCVGNVWEWLDELITNASQIVLSGTTNPVSYTYSSSDGGRAGKVITTGSNHGPITRTNANTPQGIQGSWQWDRESPLGDTAGGNHSNGNIHQYFDHSLIALLAGGHWGSGVHAGARAVHLLHYPWNVPTSFGVRCASESLWSVTLCSVLHAIAWSRGKFYAKNHCFRYYITKTQTNLPSVL